MSVSQPRSQRTIRAYHRARRQAGRQAGKQGGSVSDRARQDSVTCTWTSRARSPGPGPPGGRGVEEPGRGSRAGRR